MKKLVWMVLLVGCAHRPALEISGTTHGVAYPGRPSYLVASRETGGDVAVWSERQPVVGHRELPAGERLDRVHALLAAVDAHAMAIGERTTEPELAALRLTITQLGELLQPYTDLSAEVDELAQAVARLPSTPPIEVRRVRSRMIELTDLIRLQLSAGR